MQFLVVGGGSMGKRRTRCLLANGVPEDNIHLVDVRQDRREEVQQKYGVTTHTSLDAGMATGPDAGDRFRAGRVPHGRMPCCGAGCQALLL